MTLWVTPWVTLGGCCGVMLWGDPTGVSPGCRW